MHLKPEILVIDDDLKFLNSLKDHFSNDGMQVAVASDAIISLSLDFSEFKIVLLDLDMPGISGEKILKKILSEKYHPKVIVVSGYSDLDRRIELLELGADFFVAKPVNLAELLLICKRNLGHSLSKVDAKSHWRLNRLNYSLSTPDGSVHGLTGSEFLILEHLISACPDFVTKDKLVKAITTREGEAAYSSYRSLEVMISRMRSRFSSPDFSLPIKALRNVGYVFHGVGELIG
jgi:two-component system, OmpR family, response regulator